MRKYLAAAFVVFAILAIIGLGIPLASSAIIDINLISPPNNNWTNNRRPDFMFVAISNTTAGEFSCSLYINNVSVATGNARNATSRTFTPTTELAIGSYSWHIGCDDGDGALNSSSRIINIDVKAPDVTLRAPANRAKIVSSEVDFEFVATDDFATELNCSLWINGSLKRTKIATNGSTEEFNVAMRAGIHSWYISCVDRAGNSNRSETRTLEIVPYCKAGKLGEIKIVTIHEPDRGETFHPGENITVEVKVRNEADDELDVVLEAELYDLDDEDEIATDEESTLIEEDRSSTISLSLTVPYNINERHDFIVRIKAYEENNEEEHCDEASVPIKIRKERHAVLIEEIRIDPSQAACGDLVKLLVKIVNIGRHKEDNIKLEISSALFNWTKPQFSLEEGQDYEIPVLLRVANNASEGSHVINVRVYYNRYRDSYRAFTTSSTILKVKDCPAPPIADVSFSTSQVADAFAGSTFQLRLLITNTGNVRKNYTIAVKGHESWAILESIAPQTLLLNPGETGYAYLTFRAVEGASGNQFMTVLVSFDNVIKQQTVAVEIKRPSQPARAFDRFLFELRHNWQWAILIAVLLLIIIVLIVLIVQQHKRLFVKS